MEQVSAENKELQAKVKGFIDSEKLLQLEEMLRNNNIVFEYNKKKYRIRKPNIKQRQIVEKEIFRVTNQLMSEGFLFEDQWKIKLKETQGIDLDSYTDKIEKIRKEIEAEQNILAPTVNETERKRIIFRIEQLETELTIAHMELTDKKGPCIDSQMLNKSVYFYAWLLTEVQIDENNWKQVWDSFEKFETDEDEGLVVKAVQIVMKYIF